MEKKKLLGALIELETQLGAAQIELDKARLVSSMEEEFFDLRDEEQFGVDQVDLLKCGYTEAALEHEIVHDYIAAAQKQIEVVAKLLDTLQIQARNG